MGERSDVIDAEEGGTTGREKWLESLRKGRRAFPQAI